MTVSKFENIVQLLMCPDLRPYLPAVSMPQTDDSNGCRAWTE